MTQQGWNQSSLQRYVRSQLQKNAEIHGIRAAIDCRLASDHPDALWYPTGHMGEPWYLPEQGSDQPPFWVDVEYMVHVAERWGDGGMGNKYHIIWRHCIMAGDTRLPVDEFRKWSRENSFPDYPNIGGMRGGTIWFGISPDNDGSIWAFYVAVRRSPIMHGGRLWHYEYHGPIRYQMRSALPTSWLTLGRGPLAAGYATRPGHLRAD